MSGSWSARFPFVPALKSSILEEYWDAMECLESKVTSVKCEIWDFWWFLVFGLIFWISLENTPSITVFSKTQRVKLSNNSRVRLSWRNPAPVGIEKKKKSTANAISTYTVLSWCRICPWRVCLNDFLLLLQTSASKMFSLCFSFHFKKLSKWQWVRKYVYGTQYVIKWQWVLKKTHVYGTQHACYHQTLPKK